MRKKKNQILREEVAVIGHVCRTFEKKKGAKYPFNGEGRVIVRRLLGLYGQFGVMALWDLFLGQSWDFVKDGRKVRIPHDLRHFQTKITTLLDENWKPIADRYEKESSVKAELPEIEFKGMPEPEDSQANKVAISKLMEGRE